MIVEPYSFAAWTLLAVVDVLIVGGLVSLVKWA